VRTLPILGAVTVGLLLVWSSVGVGSSAFVVSLNAPYTGASTYDHTFLRSLSGCPSHAHDTIPGSFTTTTGVARVSAEVDTMMCSSTSTTARFIGFVGVTDIAFTVPTTGVYNVSASWQLDARVTVTVDFNGTPTNNAGASAQLKPILCVLDLTASTTDCKTGHQFGMVNGSRNITATITSAFIQISRGVPLVAGHSYVFRASISYDLVAQTSAPAGDGTIAVVALDMHSGSYNAQLKSLKIWS
jgi:hypothetical protein